MAKRRLIIDTDAGIDDAQAILMALASPEVDVIGITTTNGNTNVDQVSLNVLRLLQVADRLDIPVYKGTDAPLLGNKIEYTEYHGKDGFGDVPDPGAPGEDMLQKEHAVPALLRMINENKGNVSLVCLAPLTNVAVALRLDPNIGKKLLHCYIMGGNYEGKGNITPNAEYNFYCDPESAHVVLKELGCSITMACWELCTKLAFPWATYDHMRTYESKKNAFLKAVEGEMVNKCRVNAKWETYIPCDEIIMAVVINDKLIKEHVKKFATVMCDKETRGKMDVDWEGVKSSKSNVQIILDLYREQYFGVLNSGVR